MHLRWQRKQTKSFFFFFQQLGIQSVEMHEMIGQILMTAEKLKGNKTTTEKNAYEKCTRI